MAPSPTSWTHSSTSSHGPAGRPAADCSSAVSQLGPMISLLPNKLYMRFHQDKAQTVSDIASHQGVVFFTSAPDKCPEHSSVCGGIDVGTVVTICRDLRAFLKNPLRPHPDRPVIYYCYRDAAEQTNAAFALAVCMILVEGLTPEEAWAPFARVKPSPWVKFGDATQTTHGEVPPDFSLITDLLQLRRLQVVARRAQEEAAPLKKPSRNTLAAAVAAQRVQAAHRAKNQAQ
ncbi:hypothetical protein T484DRAFT_1838716 [Baffinella frigidus]|nr:hypothetical protein T484DRAFT_1838716 [Cryptophyta sp. CCMP2293]